MVWLYSLTCGDSRPATSSTCVPSPRAWPEREIVQRTVAQIPWRSNLALLHKLDLPETRIWYARKAIEQGWSREILELQIRARLYDRQGSAVTNFPRTLPPSDTDLATQAFKDPYLFDFLGTAEPRTERELEQGLVDHIQRFLLEMRAGFAFVGQMNLYLSAVDDLMRHPDDAPTIGLLLCKARTGWSWSTPCATSQSPWASRTGRPA